MRIYVCVKHVPDTAANIRPLGGPAFDETVKFIINPYDEHALEQALQIRDKAAGSEVVAVTAGRETAAGTLRCALAMGADRGILVKTDAHFTDPLELAQRIGRAIRGEGDGPPSLIFTGKQSVDEEGMQMPYRLAALLDLPVAVDVVAFSMEGERVTVEREIEGGREVVEMSLPCVIGAAKALNRPRCPTLPDVMKARKKEIRVIEKEELPASVFTPSLEVLDLESVPDRGRGEILQDSPEKMARELLRRLKEEAKVLK
jgi:electron transfer flavoprotein beta subunit